MPQSTMLHSIRGGCCFVDAAAVVFALEPRSLLFRVAFEPRALSSHRCRGHYFFEDAAAVFVALEPQR